MNRAERRQQERASRRLANCAKLRRETGRAIQQHRQREAKLPLDEGQTLDLVLYANEAIALLAQGKANDSDLHSLACLSNVSLLFAERGLGCEYVDDVKAGQQAIVSMFQRFERTGRVGASGPELQAVRVLVQIHEAQLEAKPTRGEMLDVLAAIRARQQEGETISLLSRPETITTGSEHETR